MRSFHQQLIPIRAADCNDRLSAVIHSSSGAADSYGCESCHLRLIVAVNKRQNGHKALRTKEIGQNQKKVTGMAVGQDRSSDRFSRSFLGKPLVMDGWLR